MKKHFIHKIIKSTAILLVILFMSSCSTPKKYLPTAVNSTTSISFADLRLDRDDFEILNTITAKAIITSTERNGQLIIKDAEDPEFELVYVYNSSTMQMQLSTFSGILRSGYLNRSDIYNNDSNYTASDIALETASYRLINLAKELGADGIIEPLISTTFNDDGRTTTYTTTISAKPIKIKPNKSK